MQREADRLVSMIAEPDGRIASHRAPRRIRMTPDLVRPRHRHQSYSRMSPANVEWIESRNRATLSKSFDRGTYIPSVNHMHLYGRRDNVSRFENLSLSRPNLRRIF